MRLQQPGYHHGYSDRNLWKLSYKARRSSKARLAKLLRKSCEALVTVENGSATVNSSARSSDTSSYCGVSMSHLITSALVEEVFEKTFKGELRDGGELTTPTLPSYPVTTASKEVAVFELKVEEDDGMGRGEASRSKKRCAGAFV